MDAELVTLHARIAQLAEAKKIVHPVKSLEVIRDETNAELKNNRYSKNVPLAAFYDSQRLETINAILDALMKINSRLDALENK